MAKPMLGYPSRTAAAWAFAAQGDTLEEIANKIAMPRANVKCLFGYKAGRFFPSRPGRYLVDREGALHPCSSKSTELVAIVTVRPKVDAPVKEIGPPADATCPQREEDTARAVTAPASSPAMPLRNEGTAGETAPASEVSRAPVAKVALPLEPKRAVTASTPAPARIAKPEPSFVHEGVPVQRRCSGCATWTSAPCARKWCPLRPAEQAHG